MPDLQPGYNLIRKSGKARAIPGRAISCKPDWDWDWTNGNG